MTNERGSILGRRRFNKAVAGSVLGAGLASRVQEARAQDDTIVVDEDFEDVPTGTLPEGWTINGNEDQEVIAGDAASGNQSLRLSGSYGGCWEAIGNVEIRVPGTGSMTISLSMKPTTDGSPGCHGDKNGKLKLGTDDSSWSAGKGVGLVRFYSDGTVEAGSSSGSYRVGDWNDVRIIYERNSSSVTQTVEINGRQLSSTTRDVTDFESELSYFEVHSGDYTLYVDSLLVEEGGGEIGNTQSPTEASSDEADTSDQNSRSDQPQTLPSDSGSNEDDILGGVATMFRKPSESASAWGLLLGGGVVGSGYLAYRRRSSNEKKETVARECPECESRIAASKAFCGNCGTQIAEDGETDESTETNTKRDIQVSKYSDLSVSEVVETGSTYQVSEGKITETDEAVWVATPSAQGEKTLNSTYTQEFHNGIQPWAKMDSHPNLLSVYGHGTEPLPWIATEVGDYPGVTEVSDDLPVEEKIDIITQICEAVHHVHRYGIVYRNLSAESVKLTNNGQVKLRGALDYLGSVSDPDISEQDVVHQIGKIAKELLTGPSANSVPDEVWREIDRALSEEPAERHETVLHFRDSLRQAYK